MKTRLDCISSRVQTSWVKLSTAVSECVEYNKVKPEGCNPKKNIWEGIPEDE